MPGGLAWWASYASVNCHYEVDLVTALYKLCGLAGRARVSSLEDFRLREAPCTATDLV